MSLTAEKIARSTSPFISGTAEYGRLLAACHPLACRAQLTCFGAWLGWPGAVVVLVCHRGSFRAVTGPQRPAVVHAEPAGALARMMFRVSGGMRWLFAPDVRPSAEADQGGTA